MSDEPTSSAIPVEHDDPINSRILAVSEDQLSGFRRHPFRDISEQSGLEFDLVVERIQAMLKAGVIRRVRQTLLATKLAHGALVAWKCDPDRLDETFDFMFKKDPFSGHVVTRSTDREVSGSEYKLWTTLKVPQGESLEEHANVLKRLTGAEEFILMPAKGIFSLGVGHVRRKALAPGDRYDNPAEMMTTTVVDLEPEEWQVLLALKGDFTPEELGDEPWAGRAALVDMSVEDFCTIASRLDQKKVIGRYSTFLEHVKPSAGAGKRVTRFNGLFHWKVPVGMQERAGAEIGRHPILTHCYWREGGPAFGNVNIMGVVHGTEKSQMHEHKDAIDAYLESIDIPVEYTNVFWGGRSEIKPSEISPAVYNEWHAQHADS